MRTSEAGGWGQDPNPCLFWRHLCYLDDGQRHHHPVACPLLIFGTAVNSDVEGPPTGISAFGAHAGIAARGFL